MADYIRPTPRNPFLGGLADLLEASTSPERTQQMQGIMSMLGAPAVASTLNRMSYGAPLTSGAGGLGGTTRVLPDVLDAALAVAPMAPAAGQLAKRAVMATKGLPVGMGIKNVGKIDPTTGLPLNSDGTVTLFHHTNKAAAEQIAKSGQLKSAGEPSVYLTTQKAADTGYGDVVVPVRVKPSMLNLDDEFPSGRMDFSIDTGKPKGSVPVTVEKQSFQYPQEEAMRLAQQRAALPVEQYGLGLPAGNTAAQRAGAMGFDTNLYHGTTDPTIKRFDPSLAGKKSSNPFDENVFATSSPQNAGGYALNWKSYKKDVETSPAFQALSNQENSIARQFADLPAGPSAAKQDLSAQLESVRLEKNKIYNDFMEGKYVSEDATIYPLKARSQDFFPYDAAGKNWIRANRPAIDAAQQAGFEGTAIQNVKDNAGRWTDVVADSYATTNPDLFRSRFAAFDPFRRNAAIATATGALAPDLLAAQEDEAMRQRQLGLLGTIAP